jgi:hypothetical protein
MCSGLLAFLDPAGTTSMLKLFAILTLLSVVGGAFVLPKWFRLELSGGRYTDGETDRKLMPQLPPHEDKQYLLEFVMDGNDHCAQMEPVVERLEKDLKTKVRRINITRRQEFVKLYDCVGGNECGSVPFFYNRRTAQAICGATPYQNLKNLAMGKPIHFFHDAPQNVYEKVEYDPRRQRGVGWTDYLSEKLFTRGIRGKKAEGGK